MPSSERAKKYLEERAKLADEMGESKPRRDGKIQHSLGNMTLTYCPKGAEGNKSNRLLIKKAEKKIWLNHSRMARLHEFISGILSDIERDRDD